MITIREYVEEDKEQIWKIVKSVISSGDSYVFASSSKEKMRACCSGQENTAKFYSFIERFQGKHSESTLQRVRDTPKTR